MYQWNRDKRNSLRLLIDELYWSACERVTPTFRISFAVDGWWRTFESVIFNFGGIPKEGYTSEAATAIEGIPPDAGDAVRNRDTRDVAAARESAKPDTGKPITNRDAFEAATGREGTFPDAVNDIRNYDTRQFGAVKEGVDTDVGNRFAFNSFRNG